jgi:enoyl-CoA hydratase
VQSVTVEHDGPVVTITINRPQARNAVDANTAVELYEAFLSFDTDDSHSVAILTGAGDTFCAGSDPQASATSPNAIHLLPAAEITGSPGPVGPTRLQLAKPTIAAVEGYAVAGGLELALWCDLRVAAIDAVFGVFCRRWGIPLIDGGTIRLPRLIGQSRALDLILTGREVRAPEAYEMGLVNRLAGPGEALEMAVTLAYDLARLPQRCLRNDRRSVYQQWNLDLGSALAVETALGMETIRGSDNLHPSSRFTTGAGFGNQAAAPAEP